MTAIKHGLSQLLNFSGRKRAVHFWVYAAIVIVSGMVAIAAAIGPVANDVFARLRRFQIEFGTGEPDLRLFGLLFLNNLVYLGTLGLLVIFLCLSGTRGPNRFGPQPG